MNFFPNESEILVVVFVAVPGFTYLWVRERLTGRMLLSNTERILRAVSASVVTYLLGGWWVVLLEQRVRSGERPLLTLTLSALGLLLLVPALLGLVVSLWHRMEWPDRLVKRISNIDPSADAWDFALRNTKPGFVRVQMKDGRYVGGELGKGSYVSGPGEPKGLFLQKAWRLDSQGAFRQQAELNSGIFVDCSEALTVELISPRSADERTSPAR